MSDYRFLKKCRGTCQKGRHVNETNCIGINPQHSDCQFSNKNRFMLGFCPYYCPTENEKNYSGDIENVEGIRYIRQPFSGVWYLVIFIIICIFLSSIIKGSLNFYLFSKIAFVLCILAFIISLLGNLIYVKINGNDIIAVINEKGVYTPRLFLSWEKIKKIKVHYNLPSKMRSSNYFVELEFIMNIDEEFENTESVYVYFSTLKMRQHIKKHIKQHSS